MFQNNFLTIKGLMGFFIDLQGVALSIPPRASDPLASVASLLDFSERVAGTSLFPFLSELIPKPARFIPKTVLTNS